MKKRIFLIFLLFPILVFAGGLLENWVVMWIGTSLGALLILLCLLQIIFQKDIIPTDKELFGRKG